MSDQIIVFIVMLIGISIIAAINIRRLDDFLIAFLIIITPFSVAKFMPREVLGITGLSVFNLVWIVCLLLVLLALIANHKSIESRHYFSWPVVVFFSAYAFSVMWAMVDINSYPDTGKVAVGYRSLLLEDLAKPIQLMLTGWIVYAYYRITENRKIIELAILISAIFWSFMIVYYFIIGGGASDIYQARNSVTDSNGLHANSMAALAVYFLVFAIYFRPSSKVFSYLRYIAIAASLLGIVFTFSRIAYLTTIIMIGLLFFRLSRRERLITLVMAFVVGISFSALLIERVSYRMETGDLNEISAGRIDKLWLPLLTEIEKNPLFGNGKYTILKSNAYHNNAWGSLNIDSPHSAYLEVLIDMGIVGFCLLFLMLHKLYRQGQYNQSGLQYLIIAMLLLSLTGHSFYPYIASYLIWVVYGISALPQGQGKAELHPTKTEKENSRKNIVHSQRNYIG